MPLQKYGVLKGRAVDAKRAAMVNPTGPAPEQEWAMILNTSPDQVNLDGWKIADRLKNKHTISGTIDPGEVIKVMLPPTVQLGNKGGIVTLLNNEGLKVDGVSYTKNDARREGWVVVF